VLDAWTALLADIEVLLAAIATLLDVVITVEDNELVYGACSCPSGICETGVTDE
jgi:hypothetical protein